ncbi:hypothetical protein M422DRAFT_182450, partial [Sphaerobolus stellatus SS14]
LERACNYLLKHSKGHFSYTSTNVLYKENFAQLLILEATGNPALVDYTHHDGSWNFFQGRGILTTKEYPDDLDTTALALTIAPDISEKTRHRVMDEMLQYRNKDRIIQTYFDHSRRRIDPIVCINVLTLFYLNGRGAELSESLEWVFNILQCREYLNGTYYYVTAECFLYFFSRLLSTMIDVSATTMKSFREAVRERFGMPGDGLTISMRILAAASVGLYNHSDISTLFKLQNQDGSFEGYVYKYGTTGILIGNRGLATALAVDAIQTIFSP